MSEYKLTEEQAKMLIETPPREVSETHVPSDIHLSTVDRIENARQILKKRSLL